MKSPILHHTATALKKVGRSQLAVEVGSGSVAVFATPMMIALMEQAASACLAEFLDEGETSVGTYISTDHISATPEGMTVSAKAEIVKVDGNCVSFLVEACDQAGVIGRGTHRRVVVAQEKFEQRAQEKLC